MMKIELGVGTIDTRRPISSFLLADNIYNSENLLIASKGMPVTKSIKEKLLMHRINTINVYLQDKLIERNIPESRKEEFKLFKLLYDQKEQETESIFNNVKEKGIIQIDEAYSVVYNLIRHTSSYYETLDYMNYLRDFDNHTFAHSINVGILCNLLSKWLKFSEEQTVVMTLAGFLHDIGKTMIPFSLLHKPGKLTDTEFKHVATHVITGHNMLKPLKVPKEVKSATLMHHEKNDGSGYMLGLNSEEIPESAKIVAICDIYDAMISKRPYKIKSCPLETILFMESSMREHLSWQHMYVFKERLIGTFVGKNVVLNDGSHGEIIHIDTAYPTRPLIKTDTNVVSLLEQEHLCVVSIA